MLHSRAAISVQIFLNLRFLPAGSRFVDRKLDPAAAVRYHLGHERRIFCADVAIVKGLVQAESHYSLIKFNPLVHFAEADVSYRVIDVQQAGRLRNTVGTGHFDETGEESTAIILALDERMNGVPVGSNGCQANLAAVILNDCRRRDTTSAPLGGFAICRRGVVHAQSDGLYAVSVLENVPRHYTFGIERRGEDEADLILFDNVGSAVASTGFRATIGRKRHPEPVAMEIGPLLCISYEKFNRIDALQGKKVR